MVAADMVAAVGVAVRDVGPLQPSVGEVADAASTTAATTLAEAVGTLLSASARAPALAAPDADVRPVLAAVATILSEVERAGTPADADRPASGGTPGREGGRGDRGSKRRRSDADAPAGALVGDH